MAHRPITRSMTKADYWGGSGTSSPGRRQSDGKGNQNLIILLVATAVIYAIANYCPCIMETFGGKPAAMRTAGKKRGCSPK